MLIIACNFFISHLYVIRASDYILAQFMFDFCVYTNTYLSFGLSVCLCIRKKKNEKKSRSVDAVVVHMFVQGRRLVYMCFILLQSMITVKSPKFLSLITINTPKKHRDKSIDHSNSGVKISHHVFSADI